MKEILVKKENEKNSGMIKTLLLEGPELSTSSGEKEKRQKKEAADPAESLAGWARKVGGILYAVAMAKGFPVLWVHTGGLADVPIQSTLELV